MVKYLQKTFQDELEEDPTVIKVDIFHKNVKETLKNIFQSIMIV